MTRTVWAAGAAAVMMTIATAAVLVIRANREAGGPAVHRLLPEAPVALPGFEGATAWLNVSEPMTPAQLRGKVVLVVFWAYSNARVAQVMPVLKQWDARYRGRGLDLIGIHSPEFSFERSVANVQSAVERAGIAFPVVVDSDRRLWTAYRAHEWPAYYVADPRGHLVGFQIGAGREHEVETYLRGLLVDSGYPPAAPASVPAATAPAAGALATPELLFQPPIEPWFASPEPVVVGEPRLYTVPAPLPLHTAALDGVWQFDEERVQAVGPTGRLVIRYRAGQCHLVVDGPAAADLDVQLDGAPIPRDLAGPDLTIRDHRSIVRLDGPRLYRVVAGPGDAREHTVEVTVPRGVAVYACAFS